MTPRASDGTSVHEVTREYDGLGRLTAERQEHDGAADGATPAVQFGYDTLANGGRLTSMTYPNGRILHYGYNGGVDAAVSRLSSLADDKGSGAAGTHFEGYSYLGLSTLVTRAHAETGIDLTYVKRAGEADGAAGDQYTGLDRFGRVIDQRWVNATSGTSIDRYQYGYDRDSNVLFKNNLVSPANSELYHASGAAGGYDALNRLTGFARGTLSDSNADGVMDTVATATRSQDWQLDALGNWDTVTMDGMAQTRVGP